MSELPESPKLPKIAINEVQVVADIAQSRIGNKTQLMRGN